jgi:hypothetical protein
MITNCDGRSSFWEVLSPDYTERYIGQRKVGIKWDMKPTFGRHDEISRWEIFDGRKLSKTRTPYSKQEILM